MSDPFKPVGKTLESIQKDLSGLYEALKAGLIDPKAARKVAKIADEHIKTESRRLKALRGGGRRAASR